MDEEEQKHEEEEEPEDIQMDICDEEQGEPKKSRRRRMSQSTESDSHTLSPPSHETCRSMDHALVARDASTPLVKSRLRPATAKNARSGLW